jgi:hypothetical protein
MVSAIDQINWEIFFSIRLWWAHVTVTPEDRRIIVLRRGI